MIPEVSQYISAKEHLLFQQIKSAIENLPDTIDLGNNKNNEPIKLSCHILAEAVSRKFGIQAIHGWFKPHVFMSHGWCLTPEGNIIDVYPCGILGGPLLVWKPDPKQMSNWIDDVYIIERDTTDARYPGEGSKHQKFDLHAHVSRQDLERAIGKLLYYLQK